MALLTRLVKVCTLPDHLSQSESKSIFLVSKSILLKPKQTLLRLAVKPIRNGKYHFCYFSRILNFLQYWIIEF